MDYLDLSIEELHQKLVNKEVTPLSLTQEAIRRAKDDKTNAFETICEKEALEFAESLVDVEEDNLLWGIPFLAKDNFSTKNILTTGSSNILKDYVPVFDATVIQRLKEKKCVLIGKTTLDELAMGGTGTSGHKGITYNPYDPSKEYLVGGSSAGSASATAQGIVPFALGSDTGDSVRKPASYAGLVGFKPSWGRISRYGLFPFAPSLDHVAYFSRVIADTSIILNAIAGRDNLDATSSNKEVKDYYKALDGNVKGLKVAVIKQVIDSVSDESIKNTFNESIKWLEEEGVQVDYIDFDKDLLLAIFPTYLIISCAEATSNNANLDGIKFGPRSGKETSYQEVMMRARTEGFGELIKRRFVIGSYSLLKDNQEKLFLRAQKIRHIIVNKINDILKEYDAIYLPCGGSVKSKIKSEQDSRLSTEYLIAENHLAIGNFAGLPSLSMPIGLDNNFPFGANVTGRAFDEVTVLNLGYALEKHTGLKNLSVKKVKM